MPLLTACPIIAAHSDPLHQRRAPSSIPISISPMNPTASMCKSEKRAPLTTRAAKGPQVRRRAGKANPRKNSSSPSGAARVTVISIGIAFIRNTVSSMRCLASKSSTTPRGSTLWAIQVRNETTG